MTKKSIFDCATGELVVRDMTEAEEAEYAADIAASEALEAARGAAPPPRDLAAEIDALKTVLASKSVISPADIEAALAAAKDA